MLHIIGGPMFSGKTSYLIDTVSKLASGTYQLYKPALDTRYAIDECVTHDGLKIPALNLTTEQPDFSSLPPSVTTILLDELNFFNPEIIIPVLQAELKQGRDFIGAGLLLDSKRQPFGATLPLSQQADTFTQLFAICDNCQQQAEFNYSKVIIKGQLLLGASEAYGACCENCWPIYQDLATTQIYK
ncbi:MAG: hypothetical protein M3Q81_05145 [bacterium]|nr:hypothetical protein [bacterium]